MIFRHSNINDLQDIMNIIKEAKEYFKSAGIDQWQGEYPQVEVIKNDIENNTSFVLEINKEISAISSVIFDGEETYNKIFDGEWISDGEYTTIHRIAVDNKSKGLGLSTYIIKQVEKLSLEKNIRSIRVDTHRDNLIMQRILVKNDFKFCGVIYLKDGNERLAYEKLI